VPSKLFAITLGTLSTIGGFIDIGDLVADAQVGARFGLRLGWVVLVSMVGIACYAEMSGRVALKTQRPALALARSRLGPRYAIAGLLGSLVLTGLLVMAELSGVALAFELATGVHYLLWIPLAAALVLPVITILPSRSWRCSSSSLRECRSSTFRRPRCPSVSPWASSGWP
jgi:Mn2+/Fe2+ NRAMP family transporter